MEGVTAYQALSSIRLSAELTSTSPRPVWVIRLSLCVLLVVVFETQGAYVFWRRSRMKTFMLAMVALSALGGISAIAQDVRYDFDKDKDFLKYKTYKWVSVQGADKLDDLTAKQLTAAIDAELAKKGLTMTDSDNADLCIDYQTAISAEKEYTAYNSGWDTGPGWGAGWYGYGYGTRGMSTTTYGSTSTIYVGQLDLSMYDASQKQLVWRGVASKTLDAKAKPDKKEKNINKGVQKLLRNYPPQ